VLPELTVRVTDADPWELRLTLVELSVAVGPVGTVDAVRLTVPFILFRLDRVMVEVCDIPTLSERTLGLAEIVKSGPTLTDRTVEYVLTPLVPTKVTLYEPAGVLLVVKTVSCEVTVWLAVTVTVAGLTETVGPFVTIGEVVAKRETEPAKFCLLVRLIVDVAEDPAAIVKYDGELASVNARVRMPAMNVDQQFPDESHDPVALL